MAEPHQQHLSATAELAVGPGVASASRSRGFRTSCHGFYCSVGAVVSGALRSGSSCRGFVCSLPLSGLFLWPVRSESVGSTVSFQCISFLFSYSADRPRSSAPRYNEMGGLEGGKLREGSLEAGKHRAAGSLEGEGLS